MIFKRDIVDAINATSYDLAVLEEKVAKLEEDIKKLKKKPAKATKKETKATDKKTTKKPGRPKKS